MKSINKFHLIYIFIYTESLRCTPESNIAYIYELLRWLYSKDSSCQCRQLGLDPWVGKILWRREWQPTSPSILAWEIRWTEDPGRLQTLESQRVGRTKCACTHACIYILFGSAHFLFLKSILKK